MDEKTELFLAGFIFGIVVGMFIQNIPKIDRCTDGTYYTKAICFYQPENKMCPVYCEDYYMYCLKGKYILQKKDGEYACLTVEEYLNISDYYPEIQYWS